MARALELQAGSAGPNTAICRRESRSVAGLTALADIVIRNIGSAPAYDVRIEITPRLVQAREAAGHSIADARMFTEPIAMLAPA
jgi:hypothetical protein